MALPDTKDYIVCRVIFKKASTNLIAIAIALITCIIFPLLGSGGKEDAAIAICIATLSYMTCFNM